MFHKNYKRLAGLFLILFFCAASAAQATDVLERTITVRFEQMPLKEVLAAIAKEGGFEWSYNANILDKDRRITLIAEGWTVRETLLYVLGNSYTFKQSGEYLILKRQKKKHKKLSGYVSDQSTGKRMANVTVYDRKTLRSTTTNKHGYYELPVSELSEIVVSKFDYQDTVLQLTSQTPRLVKLDLFVDTMPRNTDPEFRTELNQFAAEFENVFVRSSQKLSALNVRDSLHRYAQVSFLPGLGTNHGLSGSVVNDYSLNLLAGYSRGNRILEFAGLGNVTREDVSGVQAAGLFNITGDNLAGFQGAGLFNNVGNNASGVQTAGIYNLALDTVRGLQIAGVGNYAGYTGTATFQLAGVLNLAPRGRHIGQVSGIVNHAHKSFFQFAGIGNTADTLYGLQTSAIFNRGGLVKGAQIGLLNFAREIKGAQIGLINISKYGGYVTLELSTNDVLPANAAFKSGVPAFYTILTAGMDPESPTDRRVWAYGIGFGAKARMANWAGLSFDLIHRHMNEGGHSNIVQEWDQLAVALDINFGKHFSIAGGPSANMFIADPAAAAAILMRDRVVTNNRLNNMQNADGWLSAWWGWTAAARFQFK